MKIYYFEDIERITDDARTWWAEKFTHEAPDKIYITESKNGYQMNVAIIEDKLKNWPDTAVVTNLPYLLSNKYAWNDKENKSDIYFFSTIKNQDAFRSAQELATRKITKEDDIEMMYRSGEIVCEDDEETYEGC